MHRGWEGFVFRQTEPPSWWLVTPGQVTLLSAPYLSFAIKKKKKKKKERKKKKVKPNQKLSGTICLTRQFEFLKEMTEVRDWAQRGGSVCQLFPKALLKLSNNCM